MSKYIWIKDNGLTREENLLEEVLPKIKKGSLFLAYGTNYFRAGHAKKEELEMLKIKHLLELRIFMEEQEICYRRSLIGKEFQWRLASEADIQEQYYMIQYQLLDINTDRSKDAENGSGNRTFYTTVGGKYELPVNKNADSAEIVCYVEYAENGMAKIVDYRLKGFTERKVSQ